MQQLCTDGRYDFTPTTCVCATELSGVDKKHLCRPVGRLKVVIPELARLGYLLVPTTSIHDIIELTSNLEAAEALRGDLRGIPFVLARRPRKVSTPSENGQRTRREKWLLSLEPAPDWVRLQITAMERAALPAPASPLALPAPSNGTSYVDPDTGEIFDDEPAEEEAPPQVVREGPITGELRGFVAEAEELTNGSGAVLKFVIGDDTYYARGAVAQAWATMQSGDFVRVEWRHGVHPRTGAFYREAVKIFAETENTEEVPA